MISKTANDHGVHGTHRKKTFVFFCVLRVLRGTDLQFVVQE
jgi:hypothetical protein